VHDRQIILTESGCVNNLGNTFANFSNDQVNGITYIQVTNYRSRNWDSCLTDDDTAKELGIALGLDITHKVSLPSPLYPGVIRVEFSYTNTTNTDLYIDALHGDSNGDHVPDIHFPIAQ
jgi:hypothetical protein